MRKALLAFALLLCPALALAQSSPGLIFGQIPTAGQWNSYFAAKQDLIPSSATSGLCWISGTPPAWGNCIIGSNFDSNFSVSGASPPVVSLAAIASGSMIANSGAASAEPTATTPSAWLDRWCSSTNAAFPTRTSGTWGCGSTGTSGHTVPYLDGANTWSGIQTFGDGDVVLSGATSGSTTVKAPGTGGGTATFFTGSDTIVGIAASQTLTNKTFDTASNTFKLSGSTVTTASSILDLIGSTQGDVLYRTNTGWTVLAPGTSGQVLTSGGPAANISWTNAPGTGTVTSITQGTGMSFSASPCTTTCTIGLVSPVLATNGGTGVASPAAHTIPINNGPSNMNNTGTGTAGQCLASNGASADPSWGSGCWVLINTLTANNSSGTLASNVGDISSTYSEFEIVFTNLLPATNGAACNLQVHNSGSFQNTNYLNSGIYNGANGTPGAIASNTASISCSYNTTTDTTNGVGNTAGGIDGAIRVQSPGTGAQHPWFGQLAYVRAGSSAASILAVAAYWATASNVDAIQVTTNTGNWVSGTVKIYGKL